MLLLFHHKSVLVYKGISADIYPRKEEVMVIYLSDYIGYVLIFWGIMHIIMAVFSWDWYLRFPRNQDFANFVGEKAARAILLASGVIILVFGFLQIINMER